MSPRVPAVPIDTTPAAPFVLHGRIVTMDDHDTVLDDGALYAGRGPIAAVQDAGAPPPAGFEDVVPIDVKGTIYPGLIELHNHLAYNALQLWQVPKRYTNRDQWGGTSNPDYRRLISGPMKLIGPDPELMPALVRYVECKALLGATTTSQGLQLFSNTGAQHYFRGSIRNVEKTDDPALPGAAAKIADVAAASAEAFLAALKRKQCYILHLSEGTDDAARAHFLALDLPGDAWAITDSLAGIHCAALRAEDFEVLAAHGASMVWSPLSNLLLYGQTADVAAAKAAGVKIAIGSDWSPSGSKNVLGELKAARVASQLAGDVFSDRELVAMATRTPAEILKWDGALGSLQAGRQPDLVIVAGTGGDPYAHLLGADERAVSLVCIGGVPRYGTRTLVAHLGGEGLESVRVGGRQRVLNLRQQSADPVVGTLTLAAATTRLGDGLANLKTLAEEAEAQGTTRHAMLAASARGEQAWRLALDEIEPEPTEVELRPRVARNGRATGPEVRTAAPRLPLSQVIGPLELDALTVADDPAWLDVVDAQRNLPSGMAAGVRALYAAG
jgi:cytosine/adenosine deaminase-related metal-dependent hydrolase